MRSLVHAHLLPALTAFYPSRVTVQQNIGQASFGSGQQDEDWQAVEGLVDIPCACGPGRSTERAGPDFTSVIRALTIALSGYFPQITEEMRAAITGVDYDILAVNHGVAKTTTELLVRRVTA